MVARSEAKMRVRLERKLKLEGKRASGAGGEGIIRTCTRCMK